MKRIWTPWRKNYVEGSDSKKDRCFFCEALKDPDNPANLIIYNGTRAFVIVNRYPYNNGHLMVVPKEHISALNALDEETRTEIVTLLSKTETLLEQLYRPNGMNMGANLGSAAGAGVPGHFHFHILPRWVGDTNFMSTVGQTRVIPEEVEETCRRLRNAWK